MFKKPHISEFYCFECNNLDFNIQFAEIMKAVLNEATHFSHTSKFIHDSDKQLINSLKLKANETISNWLAFKKLETTLVYSTVALDKSLKNEFSQYAALYDFTFKGDDIHNPLFIKDDELIFCSVSSDGIIFLKKELICK